MKVKIFSINGWNYLWLLQKIWSLNLLRYHLKLYQTDTSPLFNYVAYALNFLLAQLIQWNLNHRPTLKKYNQSRTVTKRTFINPPSQRTSHIRLTHIAAEPGYRSGSNSTMFPYAQMGLLATWTRTVYLLGETRWRSRILNYTNIDYMLHVC